MKKPTRITQRVNTTDLFAIVAADTDISVAEATRIVTATFDVIARAAASGHNVAVTNLGTWFAYRAKKVNRRHPQTGELFTVDSHRAVRFRVSPQLADAVRRRDRNVTIRKAPKGSRTTSAE